MDSNTAAQAPLLNDYKYDYFTRRLPQTISGGLRLKIGSHLPIYIYFLQLLFFLVPLLIASLLTIPAETNPDLRIAFSYVYGALMFSIMLLTHGSLLLMERKSSCNETNIPKSKELSLDESDTELQLQKCCSMQTLQFIIQKKRYYFNIFFHALIGGIVDGVVFQFLLPSRTNAAFGNYTASIVYFIISWFVVCIGQHCLLGQTPPEPAQFRTTDHFDLSPLMRPFYVGCFAIVGLIAIFEPSTSSVDFALRIAFPFLPLIWTLGILPSLDSLFAWLGDQVLVQLLGGSPMANDVRLCIMFVMSAAEIGIVFAIPNSLASIIISTCFGLVLSLDICSLLEGILSKLRKRADGEIKESFTHFSLSKFLHLILMLVASAAISCTTEVLLSQTKKSELIDILGYTVIVCFAIVQLKGRLLSIYMFFGLLRNPIYKTLQKSRAWQDATGCSLDITLLMLVKFSGISVKEWWSGMDPYLQLLLIHLIRSRMQYAWNCLSFYARYTAKFYHSSKVRHQSYKKVALISTFLSPFWICFFVIAVLFEAPLLPLFTLPLFFTGFPRPRRFWPNADLPINASSSDWVYYKQLIEPLVGQLKDVINTGSLCNVSAGDYFLARFQDRLVWLSVLERGYMHTNVVVKGLELAETSCHTAEAAKIDDVFEAVSNDKPGFSCFNPYPTHVLTPYDFLDLHTYSDAKNVLTGVIDRPENLKNLQNHFVKSLTWVLLRYCKLRRDQGLGDGPTMEEVKAKNEEKRSKGPFRPLLTNETRGTIVSSILEDRNKSMSLHSKSSISDNSMTALWNAKNASSLNEPIRMAPLKGGQQNKSAGLHDSGMPAMHGHHRKDAKDAANFNFRGPNIVMDDDDFDDFGFDDLDNSLPRTNSWESNNFDNATSNTAAQQEPHFKPDRTHHEAVADDIMRPYPSERTRGLSKKHTLPTLTAEISSPHSTQIEPPIRWKDSIPVESSDTAPHEKMFVEDWFRHVISIMNFESHGEHVMESIASDRGLLFIFRKLVLSCFFTCQEQRQHGALDVWRVFNGELPWSQYSYWLEEDTELKDQVLLAYRYAFKIMYDEAVLGPIEDFEELAETFMDYEENWHMGIDTDQAWTDAVLANTPSLLSVGNDTENGTFTSRVLTKQTINVPIGRLDSENVRAIWASLSLELYYFTNDDEERYSIQAHSSHLRNIVIQAADPPLGYPVFSSGLLNITSW
eukprot:gene19841-21783_t